MTALAGEGATGAMAGLDRRAAGSAVTPEASTPARVIRGLVRYGWCKASRVQVSCYVPVSTARPRPESARR